METYEKHLSGSVLPVVEVVVAVVVDSTLVLVSTWMACKGKDPLGSVAPWG
jgi:hypothetical protein